MTWWTNNLDLCLRINSEGLEKILQGYNCSAHLVINIIIVIGNAQLHKTCSAHQEKTRDLILYNPEVTGQRHVLTFWACDRLVVILLPPLFLYCPNLVSSKHHSVYVYSRSYTLLIGQTFLSNLSLVILQTVYLLFCWIWYFWSNLSWF